MLKIFKTSAKNLILIIFGVIFLGSFFLGLSVPKAEAAEEIYCYNPTGTKCTSNAENCTACNNKCSGSSKCVKTCTIGSALPEFNTNIETYSDGSLLECNISNNSCGASSASLGGCVTGNATNGMACVIRSLDASGNVMVSSGAMWDSITSSCIQCGSYTVSAVTIENVAKKTCGASNFIYNVDSSGLCAGLADQKFRSLCGAQSPCNGKSPADACIPLVGNAPSVCSNQGACVAAAVTPTPTLSLTPSPTPPIGGDWVRYNSGGSWHSYNCATANDIFSNSLNDTSGGSCADPSKWKNCGNNNPNTGAYDCTVGFTPDCTNPAKRCFNEYYAGDCDCVAPVVTPTPTIGIPACNQLSCGGVVTNANCMCGLQMVTTNGNYCCAVDNAYDPFASSAACTAAHPLCPSGGVALSFGASCYQKVAATVAATADYSGAATGPSDSIVLYKPDNSVSSCTQVSAASGTSNYNLDTNGTWTVKIHTGASCATLGAVKASATTTVQAAVCGATPTPGPTVTPTIAPSVCNPACTGGAICVAGNKCACAGAGMYTSPLMGGYCNISEIIIAATRWILGLVSGIIILILIFGGITYVTSTGDEERIRTAKNTILYAIIGLAIILLAYTLISEIKSILRLIP